ncbi:MAG TPA: hypothetical protein VET30_05615, partial [Pseudoxanthomonas sp.]|nr:hypothetical protein [Pseudoxanthomonas sp.]
MPIRALIVLLIALNVGAAAWWITRPQAPPPPPLPLPTPGVPRLQLLSERAATASSVVKKIHASSPPMTPAAAVASVATPSAGPSQCFRLGPFVDSAGASAAGARVGAQATRKLPREVAG